jgi:malonate-semialdehyde dehydrogenase (acetylating)/methylmalonate-semialdehyde dehydrogenase
VPVGEGTADRLVETLAPRVRALKIGPATDPDAEMGPLVTKQHLDKVLGYIDTGVKEGAELVVDGRGFRLQGYENGYFVGGTLFDRVTSDMRIYKEEIFGPVLSVVRVGSFDEALALVNASPYGNGAAIFTDDGRAARRFQREVEAGMVGVNVPIPVPVAPFSFGGWKASLFGDLGMYGPDGVRFYTRGKVITANWPEPASGRGVELGFPTNS